MNPVLSPIDAPSFLIRKDQDKNITQVDCGKSGHFSWHKA